MSSPSTIESASTPASAPMSVLERSVAIFIRPAHAWEGLKERVQWWFPLLVAVVFSVLSTLALHRRAIVPMLAESWDQQVASGQLPADQAERMVEFFGSPAGLALGVMQQAVILPIITLVIALFVWFGVGFVLGTGMKYRLALEVAAWSSLITIPAQILTGLLAWFRQTMRGVHVGFGILLPEADVPSKLQVALGVILDGLGPLSIWYLVVGILGAAALSGAPRKSTAWTMGVLYLVLIVFMAGLAALFTPAA